MVFKHDAEIDKKDKFMKLHKKSLSQKINMALLSMNQSYTNL